MKTSLYSYLQRYLLKVLTRLELHKADLVKPLPKRIESGFSIDFVTLTFVKNGYLKKNICESVDSSLFIKKTLFLYKEGGAAARGSFFLPFFIKFKKKGNFFSRFLVFFLDKQVMFFYFQQNKKQKFSIFFVDLEIRKLKYLSSLKSFFYILLFLSKQLSSNKENTLIYLSTVLCIVFPCETTKRERFKTLTNRAFLRTRILILISTLFLLALKYKKINQSTDYKAFVFLVNRFFFYRFCKNILTIIDIKSFVKQQFLINTAVNDYFFLMRPLFSVTRLDTFYICESLKLPIYPDQSNFRVDFLRNRVRKQILPAIRILLNPQFDTILCKFNEI